MIIDGEFYAQLNRHLLEGTRPRQNSREWGLEEFSLECQVDLRDVQKWLSGESLPNETKFKVIESKLFDYSNEHKVYRMEFRIAYNRDMSKWITEADKKDSEHQTLIATRIPIVLGVVVSIATLVRIFTNSIVAILVSIFDVLFIVVQLIYYYPIVSKYGKKSLEQIEKRNGLVNRLTNNDIIESIYTIRLKYIMDKIDLQIGDRKREPFVGNEDKPLIASIFSFEEYFPAFTANSFDRILLFNILYPTIVVFATWALFEREPRQVEIALGIPVNATSYFRILTVVVVTCILTVILWQRRKSHWGHTARLLSIAGTVFISLFGIFDQSAIYSFVIPISLVSSMSYLYVSSYLTNKEFVVTGITASVSLALFAVDGHYTIETYYTLDIANMGYFDIVGLGGIIGIIYGITMGGIGGIFYNIQKNQKTPRSIGILNTVLLLLILLYSVTLAKELSYSYSWNLWTGPQVVFISILSVLGAPINWISFEITRTLIRLGIKTKIGGCTYLRY